MSSDTQSHQFQALFFCPLCSKLANKHTVCVVMQETKSVNSFWSWCWLLTPRRPSSVSPLLKSGSLAGQTLDPWSPAEICLGIIRPFKSLCVAEWHTESSIDRSVPTSSPKETTSLVITRVYVKTFHERLEKCGSGYVHSKILNVLFLFLHVNFVKNLNPQHSGLFWRFNDGITLYIRITCQTPGKPHFANEVLRFVCDEKLE